MGYWNSRGLRGSTLEELINLTNDLYISRGLAIVQKIPTSIKPVKINEENRTITLAYFEQKSTVDYIGVVQGIPICFDAKETAQKHLPLQNVHAHQMEFMSQYEQHKGVAFLLVYFSSYDEYFFLPFHILQHWWNEAQKGGRKSIPYAAFPQEYRIENRGGAYIHYLETLNTYLVSAAE
ncbi:MAG: Holliday junction resolvase RecU [Epulopiscium sp.]|nr:Holliday junction resolvase RecU [Candidatus Epulonipiscium sp.]